MPNHARFRALATAVATVSLIGGTMTVAPAALASAASVQTYSCPYYSSNGREYAGHYSGNTVVPSTTSVSDGGIEAQCLLKFVNRDPGPIDGIFGSNSQRAMAQAQHDINIWYGTHLTEDGLPGPATWPKFRKWVYDVMVA
ncbi:peptidoglycan-binding domain-containing protein [Streptomyces avermitilis]|uniref:peptidoglycan-binding domain-containing protein n=1 Tax=Streptomyces avermitilis TaxID=33903 RepID=UPI0033EA205B